MKKEFSIQFFRPPHLPLNEKQVHKIFLHHHLLAEIKKIKKKRRPLLPEKSFVSSG
jgi:hypothetical protein